MIKNASMALTALTVVMLLALGGKLFEHIDSDEILIIQSPVTGELSFGTQAGIYWQGFGTVEIFKKRDQFWFLLPKDKNDVDESLRIRFNDNSHGRVSGSVSWDMPQDPKMLRLIFEKYRTHKAVERQLVRTVIEKAVYMTGPLMSSTESAAERRNELLQLIEDQIENGVYFTRTVQEKQTDPITGEQKLINVVKLVRDEKGQIVRSAESPFKDFGVRTFNLAINEVKYDKEVEDQIQQQQKAIMQVRIAIAKAKEAEQDAITVAERGKADAAKAKWEQEKENATVVAKAEGRRRAEEQNAIAAKFYRDAQLLKAEGDAGYRAKIMQADNALEVRLKAYVEAQKIWADAVKEYQGAWVPSIVSGSAADGKAGNGAMTLIDLLSAKTARDLGLDLGLTPKKPTASGK